ALVAWLVLLLAEAWADAQVDARPRVWLRRLARWAVAWAQILRPLTALLDALAPRKAEHAVALSPETLRALLAAAGEGHLAPRYQRMVYAVIRLSHTLVREIMVPRVDMVTLEVHTPLREAVQVLLDSGFSRVPVYEERVDRIVGVLYSKDVLRYCWNGKQAVVDLRPLLREPYFVPEAKRADELLAEMQARRIHMAIVIDEYGGVAGLVTLEDIVEEIVGEIHDEYDRPEATSYRQVGEGEYLFWGRVDLDDVNDLLGTHFDRNIADTLGGFIYSRLGRIPQEGEHLQAEGWDITVEKVEGRRIQQVRMQRLESTASPAPPEESS
ncbi:MAG: HlyC/CorC family transporter, partial [Chloroflexi bacterium]|nr:HlyC/CorC family transporter [Chloroflexota bacterium]